MVGRGLAVRRDGQLGERACRRRAATGEAEPSVDGMAVVGDSCGERDGIAHDVQRDRTQEVGRNLHRFLH